MELKALKQLQSFWCLNVEFLECEIIIENWLITLTNVKSNKSWRCSKTFTPIRIDGSTWLIHLYS